MYLKTDFNKQHSKYHEGEVSNEDDEILEQYAVQCAGNKRNKFFKRATSHNMFLE